MIHEFVVTEDAMGGLHLYGCDFSRDLPLVSWHGFRSYQDLSDFFTFALRGPKPEEATDDPVGSQARREVPPHPAQDRPTVLEGLGLP